MIIPRLRAANGHATRYVDLMEAEDQCTATTTTALTSQDARATREWRYGTYTLGPTRDAGSEQQEEGASAEAVQVGCNG